MKNKMIILLFFSHTSLFALDKPPNSLFEKVILFTTKEIIKMQSKVIWE